MTDDLLKELCDLLDEAGATVTFSANCVSGLIGREVCQCWRCRAVEPGEELEGWDKAAKLISRGHSAEVAHQLRLRRYKRNCPVCGNAGMAPRCPGCGREDRIG